MKERKNRIWITWERQRRSVELAKRLNAEFFLIEVKGRLRYPVSLARTMRLLVRHRGAHVFVQNPSMILAAFACLICPLLGSRVIVDRHTTFILTPPAWYQVRRFLFQAMSLFTFRRASVTIVTNAFLADVVRREGGVPFVLPDPLPELVPREKPRLNGKKNVLVVSSFAVDEPIDAVFDAARGFSDDTVFYVSGNYRKASADRLSRAPSNVVLTGFLSVQEYVDLLFAVDAVVVLTTLDHTMLCGCYEAVAAKKPLVTSDKPELRDYFTNAEFVEATGSSINSGITRVLEDLASFRTRTAELEPRMEADWRGMFRRLEQTLAGLPS
jgi:glycosyltransferase involved in cell wall biosynthesis